MPFPSSFTGKGETLCSEKHQALHSSPDNIKIILISTILPPEAVKLLYDFKRQCAAVLTS
jgi:hypothetical protein